MSTSAIGYLCRVLSRPVAAAVAMACAVPSYAQEQGLTRIVSFGIGPQKVSTALIELSNQAGVQVLMPAAITDSKSTRGVRGTMSVEEALLQLLEGTQLRYRLTGENVIGIESLDTQVRVRTPPSMPHYAALTTVAYTVDDSAYGSGQQASSSQPPSSTTEISEELQTVIVTGTRFSNRTELESPVPVDVLSRDSLRSGGYNDTPSMLAALVPSAYFPPTSTANSGSFMRRVQIRGLNSSQVLVLVNGKRKHLGVNGGTAAADFNSLPTSSIGHIEVLRDGAAAQYGSDAIAGVVNVIMRHDLGTQIETSLGQTYEGDGEVAEVSLDNGIEIGDGGFLHSSLYYRTRGKTNRQGYDKRQMYFGTRNGNPIIFPTTSISDATPVLQSGDAFDPREFTIDRYNTYRVGDPESEDMGLSINAQLPLGSLTGYAFGGYMRREIETPFVFRAPLDNNNVRAIFPNGFQPLMVGIVTDGSFTAGIKGALGEWDFDFSQGWGLNNLRPYPSNTLNPSMGVNSPTTFYAGKYALQQAVTNFDLTRSLNVGWQSPLNLAVGAEFRWDEYSTQQGRAEGYLHGGVAVLDGPNAGAITAAGSQGFGALRPTDEVEVDRTNYAVYADLETTFWERLTLSAAGRFEKYSDFGDTTDGKLAFRFEVNDVLAFRGSASTGFRAPSLADIYYLSTSSSFIQGVSYVTRRFAPSDPVARLMGAKDLEPEQSESVSLGVVLNWGADLNFAVDLYRIEVSDQIVSSSTFNDTRARAFFAANGYPNISGASFPTNAIDARVEGIDVTGRYGIDFAASRLTLTAAMNFNSREVTRIAATPPELAAITGIALFNRDSLITYSKGQPRRTFNFSGTYELGDWTFFARALYYGEYYTGNTNPIYDQTFSPEWVADVSLARHFGDKYTVTVGANNVFDAYPDEYTAINNPQGPFRYPSSSPFGYNGGYYYLRLLAKF
ncbi:TonB-dependent receptor [Steroidobacter sp.]|uniref:TonB-dependent receptor n=1 Tax=Steroidobacter sp. TaxID=1978227 RepID=UPI001A480DA4|nr:TonB-dependent receptor [Steroidobacter sp.]MBL8266528.1 TonB-dependent receptor [Steroidobacter sp.]